MFLIFQILLVLYLLYCATFCTVVIYTAIIEEWFCQNRFPIWIDYIKRTDYQRINQEMEINIV